MPSPSNLLKKANTAKYVLNPENGGQFLKNPAYYMQPPTANSTAWSPAQPMAQPSYPYAFEERPSAPVNAPPEVTPPQYGYAPAQASFTPPPMQCAYMPMQPATSAPSAMPGAYGYPSVPEQNIYPPAPAQNTYPRAPAQNIYPSAPPQNAYPPAPAQNAYSPAPGQSIYPPVRAQTTPTPPMAPPAPPPISSAPIVHNADMHISVQPLNIPAPIISRDPAIYKALMKKHDRAAVHHAKQSST